MKNSLPLRSENLWRKSSIKFPETTRLYSQREYATPKIIPSAANVATKLFLWKAPTKMRNSLIKLLVPGNPFTDLYALIGTSSSRTSGWYTTIMKLPFIFFIRIGFMLTSLWGSRSLLPQLQKDKFS